MKISDEIRDWVNKPEPKLKPLLKLLDLADRIDNEMTELPKDSDGVPINIGDTIYTEDGNMDDVIGIYFMPYKENVVCMLSDGGSIVCAPHELSHERPDSLERIAEDIEAAEDWCDQNGEHNSLVSSVSTKTLGDWADRIRKLTKEGE